MQTSYQVTFLEISFEIFFHTDNTKIPLFQYKFHHQLLSKPKVTVIWSECRILSTKILFACSSITFACSWNCVLFFFELSLIITPHYEPPMHHTQRLCSMTSVQHHRMHHVVGMSFLPLTHQRSYYGCTDIYRSRNCVLDGCNANLIMNISSASYLMAMFNDLYLIP